MYFEKPSTRVIGIGKFGCDAIEVIKKSWTEEACLYLKNAEEVGEFSYANVTLTTAEEELKSVFESANSVMILSDASMDFELTKKVAEAAKIKGLFIIIGLANATENQALPLADVSDSVIVLPSMDYDLVFRFVETLIHPMYVPGIIGIDWEDVKLLLKGAGVGYFAFGKNREADSIVGNCLDNMPDGFELDTAKSILIHITSSVSDMYFIEGIVERVCEHLNDSAQICFSAQISQDRCTSCMGIIVA